MEAFVSAMEMAGDGDDREALVKLASTLLCNDVLGLKNDVNVILEGEKTITGKQVRRSETHDNRSINIRF